MQIYTLNISMEEIDLMYKQFIDKLKFQNIKRTIMKPSMYR